MTTPTKMTPGDELHLTLLMAPQSLNLVTGQDRQHLLAYGRAAFDAGKATAVQPHPAEPTIILTEQDAILLAQASEMLEDYSAEQRQRGNCSAAEGADCSAHAVQRLGVAMLEAQRDAQSAPAAVAVPGERATFDDFFRKRNGLHPDTDTTFRSDAAEPWRYWQARAALAAPPPAPTPTYLPLLVRDIARELGITSPEACATLKPLGNFSVNSAVTAEMVAKLREQHPATQAQDVQIEAGAKRLSELFDYPWAEMPAAGRENMRKNVRDVLDAIAASAAQGDA